MPTHVFGTFTVPGNAPVGMYNFNASGGGISYSETSALLIGINMILPLEISGPDESYTECVLHVTTPGITFCMYESESFYDGYIYFTRSRLDNHTVTSVQVLKYSDASYSFEHRDGMNRLIFTELVSPFKLYIDMFITEYARISNTTSLGVFFYDPYQLSPDGTSKLKIWMDNELTITVV